MHSEGERCSRSFIRVFSVSFFYLSVRTTRWKMKRRDESFRTFAGEINTPTSPLERILVASPTRLRLHHTAGDDKQRQRDKLTPLNHVCIFHGSSKKLWMETQSPKNVPNIFLSVKERVFCHQ